MKRTSKIVSLFFLTLVLAGLLLVNTVSCQGTEAYSINSNGIITPATSQITHSGNTYSFVGDLSGSISVSANNIIIDGNGYTLEGPVGIGIWLNEVNNVTIKNLSVNGFSMSGIYLTHSSNNTICYNDLSSNDYSGLDLENASNNNNIFANNFTGNYFSGVRLSDNSPMPNVGSGSDYNNIYENNITANLYGVFIGNSSNNEIYNNKIVNNTGPGIEVASSSNNRFYLNNVVGNSPNAKVGGEIDYFTGSGIGGLGANIWDNGSAGNYWGDYTSKDSNHDGVGDTTYKIDANNIDNHPLMASFGAMALSPENKQSTLSIQNILIVSAVALSAALMIAGLIYNHKKRQSKCEK